MCTTKHPLFRGLYVRSTGRLSLRGHLILKLPFTTNNENRPLLTIGAKYYMGKTFILLRVSLLREQSWVFRWVFIIVLSTILSQNILKRVQPFILDGNSQEYGQIDNANVKKNEHNKRPMWIVYC